ncbi:hypothetical protein T05_5395 [Trichinella murrelli]|uniref:Uncharacterized protein n=1 Tax=Trichinella murrelli TaxID=144512 RepID=A0A0V0TDX3_9BILA|nr:hypothetical protein T05_5395 [Trichinella murrelli]
MLEIFADLVQNCIASIIGAELSGIKICIRVRDLKQSYSNASRRLQRLVFFAEQRLDVDRRTNWIRKFVHFYYNFKVVQRLVRLQQSEDVRFGYVEVVFQLCKSLAPEISLQRLATVCCFI